MTLRGILPGRLERTGRTGECLADPAVPAKSDVQPKDILEALEYVDRRHGGPREYLLGNGLSESRLAALRDRLLE